MKQPKIIVINTGSTTTKLGYFEGKHALEIKKIDHLQNGQWDVMNEEERFRERLEAVQTFAQGKRLDLVMSRGGILKPVPSGVYEINDRMLTDLKNAPMKHASNFSAPIAKIIADKYSVKAYIADPVTVDELDDIARFSGHPLFPRRSIFHALNQKAVARRFAEEKGKPYEALNLIVVHMGGGISIGAHKQGRVVDVNQALDGEGPFSPERSGTLPAGDLIRTAFSGKYSKDEMLRMLVGEGGLKAYLKTSDVKQILHDKKPGEWKILNAMIYQISKYIGEMAVVLEGNVDAVILTGGLAYSGYITNAISRKIQFLAKEITVFPGEDELEALAYNGYLVCTGQINPKVYK